MPPISLCHVALNVRDAQAAKKFYCELFGMSVEWEPDPKNVYLTNAGRDNLALHESSSAPASTGQKLDHIGFAFASADDVDAFYAKAKAYGAVIVHELKRHRDGAYSFYLTDPDGTVIQAIYHPPIAAAHKK